MRWSEDIDVYTCNALAPAEIESLEIDEDENQIDVVVASNQLSLAIGHKGQNVRLASKLIGYKINVVASEEEDLSINEQLEKELAKSNNHGDKDSEIKVEHTEAIKDEEIEGNAADIELKTDVQTESTESEAEITKEEVSEDSEEIIENKNKDDHQKEEVAEKIDANADFETNSANEADVYTKKNETKEEPKLEVEVESDAS